MFNYETVIKENHFQGGKSKFHPKNINEFPKYKNYMDRWSNLAFKRHDEFQKILKIKSQIDLVSDGFDKKENLDYFETIFYSSNINEEKNNVNEDKTKAKKEKEKKAKEEKESKAKEDTPTLGEELSVDDLMSKIKELNEMYKSGVISKEEFEMLKGKLLKK